MLNASHEAGYNIPDDSELICILNNKYLMMVRPNISAYTIPEYDMGAVSMRLLTKMLMDDQSVEYNRNIEMAYSKMPRNTTK
jgi:LacI family transcriptional regulator